MPKNKTVLITGGAGFIGSHVADQFARRDYEVTVVDNLSRGDISNHRAANFYDLDIRSKDFFHLVRSTRFDVICHLAAQIDVRAATADPITDASINIVGTLNLLEGVRASGGRPRIIFTSTGGALYGCFDTPPHVETSSKDPDSPYGIAKLAAEYYVAYYGRIHDFDCVTLRFGNVYGPRQNPEGEGGVIAVFCSRILLGEPLVVYGSGSQTRDYVYVGDAAQAVVRSAQHSFVRSGKLDQKAFNIGTGTETSVLELIRTLKMITHRDLEVTFREGRLGEQGRSRLNVEKASRTGILGHVTPLPDGLSETFRWFSRTLSLQTEESPADSLASQRMKMRARHRSEHTTYDAGA